MDPDIRERMNNRIRHVIKERTGPSFEQRSAAASKEFRKKTKLTEDSQAVIIQAAVDRARARPCESAPRAKELIPPSIDEHGKEHAHIRRSNEKHYAKLDAERQHRMDTREPLFKLEEVAAAFDNMKERISENKKRMTDDENKRWEHLREVQERVIHRPLLMEDPSGGSGAPKEENTDEEKEKDPNWKAKFHAKMNRKIKQTISDRSGPSFEERVAVRSAKFRREAMATVNGQTQVIEAAIARAKARPSESPFRTKEETPPSIEDWGHVHKQIRADNEARYGEEDAARQHRMNTREPLFRVSEVQAAFEMQEKRQAENKKRLRDDEKERWAFLAAMQEKVIDRPLLVEKFERERNTKSNPDIRLIPNHSKPVPLQATVSKCVSQKWFKESAWGKEVEALHARMDARPKLHEIAYPPKKIEEKPPPPKMRTPLDDRLAGVMQQAWFKNSQWASDVKNIQQRQNDRVPLSEISYPPKKD